MVYPSKLVWITTAHFYDNKSASPFPSVIHLWLIALGIQVRFIRKRPPLEHSRIERHHQTIAGQAFDQQSFADITELQRNLQARMLFLNREYPTLALNQQSPLQAFPQAQHSSRIYYPEMEEQSINMHQVYEYLKTGRWFRQISSVDTFSLGSHLYNVTTQFADQALQITFDAQTHKLICLPEKSTSTFQLDVQGLTQSALMGKASLLPAFANFQLALPFPAFDTTL